MIKAIIFDCFGVLVGRGFEETYRIAGGDPVIDRDFIADTLGVANLGMIDDSEFELRIANRLLISVEEYRAAILQAEQLNNELLQYIAELHGTYATAILSNVNNGVIERKIPQEILTSHFDALVLSGELKIAKPDPRIYELAAEKLSVVPTECVFTDDRLEYCQAAEALGMQAIRYIELHQFKAELNNILAK